MKRCPQCSFLYLDSDRFCDLDKTPLIPDDFGTDVSVSEQSELKAAKLSHPGAVLRRRLNLRTVSAACIACLIISVMLLASYQRMRPTLQASQVPPTPPSQGSQVSRVSEVAQQALNDVSAKSGAAQEDPQFSVQPDLDVSPSAKPSSTTAKTAANARSDSTRVRVSSNPVSTGNVAKPGRGQVTIRLADSSTLQADEVWRTKAGIWYRRKGIVTFLNPNRVRSISK